MKVPEFLFHYYERDNGPFRNITEYGYERALTIQSQISEGFNSKRPNNYVDLRISLESRIREHFILKGGKPNRYDPFYFTLGECEWAKSWYKNPAVIRIPLADFKAQHISFTYPDSMVSYQLCDEPKLDTYRKDCSGQIFLLNEISTLISKYGLPSEEKSQVDERLKYDKYIEAQVWDDSIIKTLKQA